MVKETLQQLIPVTHYGANAGQSNHITKARACCFLALILEVNLSSAILLAFIKLSNTGIMSSFSFVFVNNSL